MCPLELSCGDLRPFAVGLSKWTYLARAVRLPLSELSLLSSQDGWRSGSGPFCPIEAATYHLDTSFWIVPLGGQSIRMLQSAPSWSSPSLVIWPSSLLVILPSSPFPSNQAFWKSLRNDKQVRLTPPCSSPALVPKEPCIAGKKGIWLLIHMGPIIFSTIISEV